MTPEPQTALSSVAVPRAPFLAWAVFKREIKHYLQSPGTYVALAFFFLLAGAFFKLSLADFVERSVDAHAGGLRERNALPLNVTQGVVTPLFSGLNFIMLMVVSMLTMRLVAEEKRQGSFELLVTTPLSDWDILLGKYFAALALCAGMLAVCAVYPAICFRYSRPETAVVISSFLGLFLVTGAYTAFGLFASALSESQIAASIMSFAGLLMFYMVGWIFKAGALGVVAAGISLREHSESFTKGVIAAQDVLFFVLFIVFFLALAAQALDARRYKA